jgi:dipeptidyl aminopeptidase/acylaminoacyl peptidase
MSRIVTCAGALVFCVASLCLANTQLDANGLAQAPGDTSEIPRLIQQLGSSKFRVREAASARLLALGRAALPALHTASSDSDAEIRRRAENLIAAIMKKLADSSHVGQVIFRDDARRALILGRGRLQSEQGGGDAWFIDLATGKNLGYLRGWPSPLTAVDLSPDGQFVLCRNFEVKLERPRETFDPRIYVWGAKTGKEVRQLVGHTGVVKTAVFSPDGRQVLSAGHLRAFLNAVGDGSECDPTLRLWDLETGKEVRRFEGHTHVIAWCIFSPDGSRILSSGTARDKTMRLWDVSTAEELYRFDLTDNSNRARAVFSPDGRWFLTGAFLLKKRDGKPVSENGVFQGTELIRMWDVETGKELRRFHEPKGASDCLAVSGDGRRALSGGWAGCVQLWDTETGKALARFTTDYQPVIAVAFSSKDTKAVAVCYDESVHHWELPK